MSHIIAVISSTIYPPNSPTHDGQRTWSCPKSRIEQTQKTIESLLHLGISEIYLADNSGENWIVNSEKFFEPAKVYVFKHYQYKNKGISELYLLLSILDFLPSNTSILKISGRYTLNKNIASELGDADLAVKIYNYNFLNSAISTRCYLVKNKDIYAFFLKRTLREIYAYPSRIVGLRSLLKIFYNSLFVSQDDYPYEDPRGSIESAAARAIKIFNYRVNKIETLSINGFIGGDINNLFTE
jgi:hypothetical protein